MSNQPTKIERFLDDGKVAVWPSKTKFKQAARQYLAKNIEPKKYYTEKEINHLLNQYHTFNDPALLRRELCDHGLLKRNRYGTRYWREKVKTKKPAQQ